MKPHVIADIDAPLYVVTAVSNPVRYWTRYAHHKAFAKHVADSGARLLTVEAAFGDRPFEVTSAADPMHLRLRTGHELWIKERAINLGIARLNQIDPGWKYVAWIDADVLHARHDWAQETIQQLQHHQVVQTWTRAFDLGPDGQPFGQATSFAASYAANRSKDASGRYGYWHSGYGWAARREAIDTMGGLLDFAPLGSADFYMAWAMIGELGPHLYQDVADRERHGGFHPEYVQALLRWQDRAAGLRRNIGAVPGTLLHYWHGKKANRGYNTRENILIDNSFNPHVDIKPDASGLYQLCDDGTDRAIALRDQVRGYFRSRNEDSIDP